MANKTTFSVLKELRNDKMNRMDKAVADLNAADAAYDKACDAAKNGVSDDACRAAMYARKEAYDDYVNARISYYYISGPSEDY
jgi:hypothetical protein